MQAATDRAEFAPPEAGMQPGAVALAVVAHLFLLGALSWGVHWKQTEDAPAIDAELWSSVVQQAAPRDNMPPPEPLPVPAPAPVPRPAPPQPPPPPPPEKARADIDNRDADIAVEREKKRVEKEKDKARLLEIEKKERARKEKEKEKEDDRQEKLEKQERDKKQQLKDQQKEQDREKAEKLDQQKADQKKLADDKKKLDDKRKTAAQEKSESDARYAENMRRMQGLAGATGADNSTGKALRSSGPSGSYGGKVKAKVLPLIVFTDDSPGNPAAEVEVRAAPDGTIIGRKLVKSSGVAAWDDAVLKAIDKAETLPKDVDGRVPAEMIIRFRVRD